MKQRNIMVCLQCFVEKGNKYLMLHRNKSKKIMPDVWMAPGGKRELNEGLFECAKREIREETGLEIKNLRIKAAGNAYLHDVNLELYFHFIMADYKSGSLIKTPADGQLAWFTPKEIGKLDNLLSEIHKLLPYIFTKDARVVSYKAVYDTGNHMTDFTLESP